MQVQKLFERLSYGELSSLSIGSSGAGEIQPGKEEQVLSAIELALTGLYTKFKQRTSFLILEAMDNIPSYILDPLYCESDSTPGNNKPRYIKDVTLMTAPFPDDLIKIISVTRQDSTLTPDVDEELPFEINGNRNTSSNVKIMAYNEFRLLTGAAGDRFEVEYQAKHPKLEVDGTIQLAPALEEALQARAAAALFAGMTGEAHVARSQELLMRYERLCDMAMLNDMVQESSSDDYDRLRAKGFI